MPRIRILLLVSGLLALLLPLGAIGLGQGAGEVQAFILDNGLEALLVDREGLPITSVDMWVNTGSINETTENAGISHFFEHMLFKGTPRFPGGFDRIVEGLGGRSNASTSFDWTHYYITVPSEHTEVALDIIADITQNSSFPPEEVQREREVVFREIDQRSDDPRQFIFFTMFDEFFQVHPYGLPILGTVDSLEDLTREDFLDYLHRYYAPNNMTLVVVGDLSIVGTLVTIQEKFGGMTRQELSDARIPQEPPLREKILKEIERDVNQGYLLFGWPAPSVRDARDVYAMDVLLAILSEGRGSRFYQKIRKELGLVTAIDAGYLTQKDPGIFTVYAEFPYQNRFPVERAVLQELQRILDGELGEAELERAKTMTLSSYSFSAESNSGLAATLGFYAIVAGDHRFALTYPEGIRSVTVDDVVATARKYIDPERYLEVVLIPEGRAQVAPTSGAVVLENGIKLIMREDHNSDVVAIQAFVGTGLRAEPPGQAGIATLTQRMLLKGTETRTEEEIFEQIENLGARIDTGDLPDMVNLFLAATADTIERALPIYLDALLHPSFPAEELDRVKDEMQKEIQANADQNFNVIYDSFQEALYGTHPYGRSSWGTVETVQKISREDVLDFYEQYYVPDNMVVVAVGDFNRLEMQALLAEHLGELEQGAAPELPLRPIEFGLDEPKQVEAEKHSNLTWMILGYPGPSVGGLDYPAMKLLNAVIGGGASSRLFTILRDQQGLAYSTGSFFPSRRQESHLVTYIIAAPENAEVAKEGILEILEDIKENGVSGEELERAKNYVIGNYLIDHETAERRAWYLGWYETLGVDAEMDERYPELIRGLTSEDLQRVAQRYFTNYVVSVLGPGN